MDWIAWVGFLLAVGLFIALDLGVFHRKGHVFGVKEALGWTIFWVAISLVFNVVVYFLYLPASLIDMPDGGSSQAAKNAAVDFLTAYLLEKSLSIDNIFVIALIFDHFKVKAEEQHRVLVLGIIAAIILRGIMIGAGVTLLHHFEWISYIFGGLLFVSAIKLLTSSDEGFDPDKSWLVRLTNRYLPVLQEPPKGRFLVWQSNRWHATTLLLALVMVEFSDAIFAIDSIPAVFAVTNDAFIAFTSNICAILGLRALFFVLVGFLERFRYVKACLAIVLAFVGFKMLSADYLEIPNVVSLAVICLILCIGVAASFIITQKEKRKGEPRTSE